MKRIFLFLVVSLAWVCRIHAQIAINETNFPDKNFRNWVLAQDYGADGQLTKAEISDITVIDVSQQNIANLKGIEHFSALLELNCSRNRQMETLDLSNNTELTSLNCDYDQLTALDLSNNVALNIIKCYDNQLTILDVSKNINLVKLDCSGNKLSSLDVSRCGQLSELTCFRNQLTSLDVYSNTALTSLVCYENQLTSLDVSNNPELFRLNCYTNKLTSLDVSKNTKLVKLFCFDNQLTTLDVTNNALLNDLRCYMNKIGEVAMSKLVSSLPIVTNGTFTVKQLDNENDQNYITTIQVATAKGKGWKVYSTDGWYFTDYKGEEPTIYSIIIDATNFPDTNFRNWLLDEANISGNGADGVLTDEEIAGVTTIDVNNLEISDLAGIEFFTALTTLNCRFTKITSIDLSRNTVLKNLDCRNNTLTALNVANNTALTALRCSRNKITSLDVSKNTELTVLRCNYNQLTALDVSQNTKLEQLDCFGNKIGKTAMGNLVASLPNVTNGKLYVIDTTWSSEENICTTDQVNAAKTKGWTVYDNHGGNAVEYAGSSEEEIITFADANVKAICVANWDTNGDGELSKVEAATVSDLGKVFYGNQKITTFNELQYFTGLTSIGYQAFYYCRGLTSITIPNSVKSIGGSAFSGCSGLTSVTIPNSVTSIGNSAFRQCFGLTSVIIPNSVTSIEYDTFEQCSALTSIVVESGNTVYDSRYNCNAIIETSTNTLIAGCKNTIIPNNVTGIGGSAFSACSGLTSITIPNSVTKIGGSAFFGCSGLTSITIGNSVSSIGRSAFSSCSGLTSIVVESGNTVYDSRNNCNAIIETSTNTLIAGCKNTIIPGSVTSIGYGAFYYCTSLTSITIPNSVKSIGSSAFTYCYNLTSVTIPNSVMSIGTLAFQHCFGLTSVVIPNSVKSIGYEVFEDCRGLTSITIPNSVTSIDERAFFDCTGLTSVISEIQDPFIIDVTVFSGAYEKAVLMVPAGTKSKYEATNYWNKFTNIVEMDLTPVDDGETVDFGNDIDDDTNLNGNVVGDVLYNISSDGGGYSDVEGCIVVTKPTDDTSIDGQDIFGEDFKDNYNGIVFKVPAGKGSVKVEAQTTGSMMLKVKIGNNDPVEMALQGKLKVTFPYNVTEATYVYIYGSSGSSNAPGMLGAPSATGGELKLYGIEVDADATGISNVNVNDNDNRYYTLDGRQLQGKPTQKGVYIVNGRKVVIK